MAPLRDRSVDPRKAALVGDFPGKHSQVTTSTDRRLQSPAVSSIRSMKEAPEDPDTACV